MISFDYFAFFGDSISARPASPRFGNFCGAICLYKRKRRLILVEPLLIFMAKLFTLLLELVRRGKQIDVKFLQKLVERRK